MRICFAAAEVAPFAKTGGLADVAGALPVQLAKDGHDVRLFMPLHAKIDQSKYPLHPVQFLQHIPLQLGSHGFHFSVYTTRMPGADLDVYFISCPQLFHREGIYTGEWDEHLRFALFARAILESCQRMGFAPEIVHCNDWHTALLPLYLRTLYSWDRLFHGTKTVLTIHNIAYQGVFPAEVIANLGLWDVRFLLYQEDLERGFINFMKTGLLYADAITAVSKTYAQEIQGDTFGAGLQTVLRSRSNSVQGIVNGVDYDVWNPATDALIDQTYDVDTVAEGKAANRRALLKEIGLRDDPRAPVLAVVSRLTAQKGFDLIFEPMAEALRYLNVRFLALGSGEPELEARFHQLHRAFPQRMWFYRGYNEKLAHRLEAAADIFVMPSRFEPCGLNQMYSLKYGAVPIVRKTGGLADTVKLYDPDTGQGTGIVFDSYDVPGFTWALRTALTLFKDRPTWERIRRNGMLEDYSWKKQSAEYEKLYRRLAYGQP
jgi:starch synthase